MQVKVGRKLAILSRPPECYLQTRSHDSAQSIRAGMHYFSLSETLDVPYLIEKKLKWQTVRISSYLWKDLKLRNKKRTKCGKQGSSLNLKGQSQRPRANQEVLKTFALLSRPRERFINFMQSLKNSEGKERSPERITRKVPRDNLPPLELDRLLPHFPTPLKILTRGSESLVNEVWTIRLRFCNNS